eukprot:7264523-Pyramimonas_sp.AAC.1
MSNSYGSVHFQHAAALWVTSVSPTSAQGSCNRHQTELSLRIAILEAGELAHAAVGLETFLLA